MYTEKVKTQDQAICHLFFHCCFKDGRVTETEIDAVSEKIVEAGLHRDLSIRDEVIKYRSYEDDVTDDAAYVRYLLQLISPANELALYSYCVELCLGDAELSSVEEGLLKTIALELKLAAPEEELVQKLATQRKVVETQKIF